MASTVSNLRPLGDSKHGGALFTLPRELRDDIYRLLVKGCHLVFGSGSERRVSSKQVDKPDSVILRISQATSHEAQEVFYSESAFHYSIDFNSLESLDLPTQTVKRMKNLNFDIREITSADKAYYPYQDDHLTHEGRIMAICEAFIVNFTGTEILRNALQVRFYKFMPETMKPISNYFLRELRIVDGFRTVVVTISPRRSCKILLQEEQSQSMGSNGEMTAKFERATQAVKDAMEPTLGPAIIGNYGFTIYLEFCPREYGPAILRAQAQKLLLDADRLERGG